MYTSWPCPAPGGSAGEEMALDFRAEHQACVLILPPLFEEANKFRHQILEIMIQLSSRDIGAVCPDLPGCNESPSPHSMQTLIAWSSAAAGAATHFEATHVLAIRSSSWIAPQDLPGWLYAPAKPQQVLRGLLRARALAAREAGREETAETLLELGRQNGFEVGGWELGAALIAELEHSEFAASERHTVIEAAEIGGKPLWLRAENDSDPQQAAALAALIAAGIAP